MTRSLFPGAILMAAALLFAVPAAAWKNGPPHNKITNKVADCADPPYSTHDWIAEHAMMMLPEEERRWIEPHRLLYRIGTEAPDYDLIEPACGAPNRGYRDTGKGRHDLRWSDDFARVTYDHPARRAQEEYDKAAAAFRSGKPGNAAYYLGAVAHYVGDLSQYGHAIKGERHHHDYEEWVGALTPAFGAGPFVAFLEARPLAPRGAYEAVVETGRVVAKGGNGILPPAEMDRLFDDRDKAGGVYLESIGRSLNVSVNEMASVLHKFHRDVVAATEKQRP